MVGGVGTMMFFLIQVMTCDAWTDPVRSLVERFDRRGIESMGFELYTSEFGQNSIKIQCILLENSKKFRILNLIFQHFRKCFRNSDKISSNSDQNSMIFFENGYTLQKIIKITEQCKKFDEHFQKY